MKPHARTIALMFALAILPYAAGQAPGTGATASPDHITLTWTEDTAKSMTITWRTDTTVSAGYVQYQKGSKLTKKARQSKAEAQEFVSDLGPARLFTSTLTKLSAGTTYTYRVGDGNHWSDASTFTTANHKARTLKFLVFGDSQASPPYALWRKTVQQAYQAHPDATFMVNVGDLVDYGQLGAHWNAWFSAAQGVINRIPIMPSTGNHESYGSRSVTKPLFWTQQFALPQNGPEGMKEQAYSYDVGPVHFIVLDSQQEEQRKSGDILRAQQVWLEADLAASKAPWKIAFFHRPPYGTFPQRDEAEIRNAFCPILEKHHVNLVFNAHDHGIARTPPIRNGAFMPDPSQGTIYLVVGQSGGKSYKTNIRKPFHSFFHNPVDQPNYWIIEAAKKSIRVRTVKQDGTFIDGFTIDRKGKFELVEDAGLKKAA